MENHSQNDRDLSQMLLYFMLDFPEWTSKMTRASFFKAEAMQTYAKGVFRSFCDFMVPAAGAMNSLYDVEQKKALLTPPQNTSNDYFDLMKFNAEIGAKGFINSLSAVTDYYFSQSAKALRANLVTYFGGDGEDAVSYTDRQRKLLDLTANGFPKAILNVKKDYGVHPDNGGYIKIAETERFNFYQVLPSNKDVPVNEHGKPVVIIPPYVLGPHIMAFLPGENKSYIHSFANQGIPTYFRMVKDIDSTPAVQVMTCEEDALDTRGFCEQVMQRHGRPVTINGFCQGGFVAVLDVLSGQLDGIVDALITCVSPMDGTKSHALVDYIRHLPPRFRDLGYAVKTLPNGNQVVDGKVMSWVYKLKSMDVEAPVVAFNRDMVMLERSMDKPEPINKTAAALNYWMIYDRTDLPLGMTAMSFASYTKPVDKDGNLPIELFGRRLNFKRIKEKGVKWLICIADKDDLIDPPAALAPLDFIEAEVSVFPKGHGSIATSWSLPTSECALHTYFRPANKKFGDKCRGPVKFHMDLDSES